ncbi:uncharacterized protein LOC129719876 [Wyeomyia smithii]|uniref:uncharacterized protein LOC129719876 n=1 Tax=Wyeomyia smithii TaxID=174621 RepID=UPI002467C8BC|nr:uncharacterized protein LOC129719876 [Wyeomyia smithii]
MPFGDVHGDHSFGKPYQYGSNYQCTDNDSGNTVWLYYQNTRGLRTKIDELFLTTRECNFDIIILTETGLDDRVNSLQLFGTTFNVFRCDRSIRNSNKSSFGGVLIAVAQCHPSSFIETVSGECLEQVCVSATVRGTKLLLCGVYIPPDRSHDVKTIDAHISSIGELFDKSNANDIVFVCGDYNQPRIVWMPGAAPASVRLPVASATLIDGMDYLNLRQQNYQRNHNDRTLDSVFCFLDHQLTVNNCIRPLLPVDRYHPPLTVSLPTVRSHSTVPLCADNGSRLNYRKVDFVALIDYLMSLDWNSIYVCTDVDDMTARFCDIIGQWLNANVPLAKRPNIPAWSTRRLHELKRLRNNAQRKFRRLKTQVARHNFESTSDEYRRLNRELYKSYVLRVQADLRRNPKGFWNFVNSKRKCSSVPVNVRLDDLDATSESDSCELFATFLASVFADRVASDAEADIAAADVPADLIDLTTFEITTDMIMDAAKKLKRSYTPGPDGIPAIVISRCANALDLSNSSQLVNGGVTLSKPELFWEEDVILVREF